MEKRQMLNTITAALGSFLTYLFGCWDTPLLVLGIFIFLDYLTGVVSGVILGKVNSHTSFNGLLRKGLIFVVIIVATLVDRLAGTGNWIFRTAACYCYISNEGISIIENCGKVGVPLPKKLLKTLEQLKK